MIKKTLQLIFLLTLISCDRNPKQYCETLVDKLRKPSLSIKLEKWFDEQFKDKMISEYEDYQFGGLYVPGRHTYYHSYEWDLLDFDKKSAIVKLLSIQEFKNEAKVEAKVNSVFLAERSRVGIMIKSVDSTKYFVGNLDHYITKISERVAILCINDYE